MSGGASNLTIAQITALKGEWGPIVVNATQEVCRLHRSNAKNGERATLALIFVSLGGQSILGVEACKVIREQFDLARLFGLTALPIDDVLRKRASDVLSKYYEAGVSGFLVSDNLGPQGIVNNDFGMKAAIVGLSAGPQASDAEVQQNNAWTLLIGERKNAVASYSTYIGEVTARPFQPDVAVRPRYYLSKEDVRSEISRALRKVREEGQRAVVCNHTSSKTDEKTGDPSDRDGDSSSVFDIVTAPLDRNDLLTMKDLLEEGLLMEGKTERRNYHLILAPVPMNVDEDNTECAIGVVHLEAITGGFQDIKL